MSVPRILMCRPDHYGIEYEINPWMKKERQADHELAVRQWKDLRGQLESLGAEVALALVLLVGSGLLIRSFWTVMSVVVVGASATAGYFIWDATRSERFDEQLRFR